MEEDTRQAVNRLRSIYRNLLENMIEEEEELENWEDYERAVKYALRQTKALGEAIVQLEQSLGICDGSI